MNPPIGPVDLGGSVWLSTTQAAAYTGRHQETVLAAAASGRLESAQIRRGCNRRYRREWLDEWVLGQNQRRPVRAAS